MLLQLLGTDEGGLISLCVRLRSAQQQIQIFFFNAGHFSRNTVVVVAAVVSGGGGAGSGGGGSVM